MFTEITEKAFVNPNGEELKQKGLAIVLNFNGDEKTVPIKELYNMELDTDYLDDASTFYFDYKQRHYSMPVPPRDTADWEILQEIIDPE